MADDIVDAGAEFKAEIEALKAKNRELIAEVRKAKGTTNEEAAKLAEEVDFLKADKVKLEGALKKATEGLSATEATYKTTLETKSAALQRLIREEGLVKELTNAGVKKEFLGPVAAYLRDKVAVDEEKGEAFVEDKGTRKPLSEFITAWSSSEEGKNFIMAPTSIGGGSQGPGIRSTSRVIYRSEFDALQPAAKMAYVKEGGVVQPNKPQ